MKRLRFLSFTAVTFAAAVLTGASLTGVAQDAAVAPETASPANSAVVPVPRGGRQLARHEKFNETVKAHQGAIDLVFIGDSITQGWEGNGKNVWKRYYGNRKALNLGIGGDRTEHVLWRLDNGNVDGISPKVAVVMIGTNNSGEKRNSASQIVEGVTAVVGKLREKLPETKVLLLGIFPRGKEFNAQRGKILQVNQAFRRMHNGKTVIYADIGHRFIEDDGSISKGIMPDALHLSQRGYRIWASGIEGRIAKWLGDKRVKAAGRRKKKLDPSGEWSWSIDGPDGNTVEGLMTVKLEGGVLSGSIAMGEERKFSFEEGKWKANTMTFRIRRDRPEGGEMIYDMKGVLEGDSIKGSVKTEMDGQEVTREWGAKRKKS